MLLEAFVAVAVAALAGLVWLVVDDAARRARALDEGISARPSFEHLPPRLRALGLETRTLRLNVRAASRAGALAHGEEGQLDLLVLVRDVGAWLAAFERLDPDERGAVEQAGLDPQAIVDALSRLEARSPVWRAIRRRPGARRHATLSELEALLAHAEEALARTRWSYRT